MSTEQPQPAGAPHPTTALEKHVAFFDKDGDGYIRASETFAGFRKIGFNVVVSVFAAFLFHIAFSWITMGYPDLFFRIRVKSIRLAKHGSDSEIFTSEGDFDEARFDEANTQPPHTQISWSETMRFVRSSRNAFDPVGSIIALGEWSTLFLLISTKDGVMKKEDVRGVFDGTLFYHLTKETGKT
ncbi:hypothetical protein ONZ45_g18120 [Pleurotus djamor]|nr:hypothetical protein ONZ45_g18120 [Pleurotus djamor]